MGDCGPDVPTELSALKAFLRQTLLDDNRQRAIFQSIRTDIENLDITRVLQPMRYQGIQSEHRRY